MQKHLMATPQETTPQVQQSSNSHGPRDESMCDWLVLGLQDMKENLASIADSSKCWGHWLATGSVAVSLLLKMRSTVSPNHPRCSQDCTEEASSASVLAKRIYKYCFPPTTWASEALPHETCQIFLVVIASLKPTVTVGKCRHGHDKVPSSAPHLKSSPGPWLQERYPPQASVASKFLTHWCRFLVGYITTIILLICLRKCFQFIGLFNGFFMFFFQVFPPKQKGDPWRELMRIPTPMKRLSFPRK